MKWLGGWRLARSRQFASLHQKIFPALEAETAVAALGVKPVVLNRHGKMAGKRDLEGRQHLAPIFYPYVPQGQGHDPGRRGLGEDHPPALHRLQAVAEGEGCLGRGIDRQSLAQMAADRLGHGAAAHDPARQEDGLPLGGESPQPPGQDLGGGRQDQLDAVFHGLARLPNKDILGTAAHVYGQERAFKHGRHPTGLPRPEPGGRPDPGPGESAPSGSPGSIAGRPIHPKPPVTRPPAPAGTGPR